MKSAATRVLVPALRCESFCCRIGIAAGAAAAPSAFVCVSASADANDVGDHKRDQAMAPPCPDMADCLPLFDI